MNLLLSPPQKPTWISAYLPINVEEFSTIPVRDKTCDDELCGEVLKRFGNRQTRIIHNELHYAVPYSEWCKLCYNCKRSFHIWYYKELLHVSPKETMPFEIFEIEIEKEATFDLWKYLGEMLHYARSDADRDEIMEMLDNVLSSLHDVAERFTKKSEEMNFTMKLVEF